MDDDLSPAPHIDIVVQNKLPTFNAGLKTLETRRSPVPRTARDPAVGSGDIYRSCPLLPPQGASWCTLRMARPLLLGPPRTRLQGCALTVGVRYAVRRVLLAPPLGGCSVSERSSRRRGGISNVSVLLIWRGGCHSGFQRAGGRRACSLPGSTHSTASSKTSGTTQPSDQSPEREPSPTAPRARPRRSLPPRTPREAMLTLERGRNPVMGDGCGTARRGTRRGASPGRLVPGVSRAVLGRGDGRGLLRRRSRLVLAARVGR